MRLTPHVRFVSKKTVIFFSYPNYTMALILLDKTNTFVYIFLYKPTVIRTEHINIIKPTYKSIWIRNAEVCIRRLLSCEAFIWPYLVSILSIFRAWQSRIRPRVSISLEHVNRMFALCKYLDIVLMYYHIVFV